MTLRIRQIELSGFRKFRDRTVIDGLTDGLNIVIEANETGKSTLLEALRAAFFVRHGTKNQLAQSYAPHGAAVGPEIQVAFEAFGAPWRLTKRFLKSSRIEVESPQGRAQGDEAESRLHTLLGSVRDTSQKGDLASYGALGLLWVAQTEALSVTPPGQIVRDAVRKTLEAEIGSIMGGEAYQRVRDRIDPQFATYWTSTGQRRGRQNAAVERLDAAETAARESGERLRALDKTFAELDVARARLKLVQRELDDETDAQQRRDLVAALETARTAAQILATRRAEQDAATAKVTALTDLNQRHEAAVSARAAAEAALARIRHQRTGTATVIAEARTRLDAARETLDRARTERDTARTALAAGQQAQQAARHAVAATAARRRHGELVDFERRLAETTVIADALIPPAAITWLEASERAVAEARARLDAGATHITLSGEAAGLLIDGEPMPQGARTLTRATRIRFGDAELVITPAAAAGSAEDAFDAATKKLALALQERGVPDLAAARARNDAARDAAAECRTLAARIQSVTPADDAIGLAAGAEALKLFVAGLASEDEVPPAAPPDVAALSRALEEAELALARAEGAHDGAGKALQQAQHDGEPLAAAEAGASSDHGHAIQALAAIEERPDFATLAADLVSARQRAADAAAQMDEARRNASAYDTATIQRRIDTIDTRQARAVETRRTLETDIARLGGTIESEGGKGLAERDAAAREEADAARLALDRVTQEADALKLLRDTLDAARAETSARFVGPVANKARRHIARLLPESDLTFSEDLALESIIRDGIGETCVQLSRGTQEQLAVLTRIAFAEMLLERGQPVSLILDDPLVYSDDTRLDIMVDILTEIAQRMQVILLTCRERAFRHVPGTRISIGAPQNGAS